MAEFNFDQNNISRYIQNLPNVLSVESDDLAFRSNQVESYVSSLNKYVNDNFDTVSIADFVSLNDSNENVNLGSGMTKLDTSKFNFEKAVDNVLTSKDAADIQALTEWDAMHLDNETRTKMGDKYNQFIELQSDSGIQSQYVNTDIDAYRQELQGLSVTGLDETEALTEAELQEALNLLGSGLVEDGKTGLDNEEYDEVYSQLLKCYNDYADVGGSVQRDIANNWSAFYEKLNNYTENKLAAMEGSIPKLITNALTQHLWAEHASALQALAAEIKAAEQANKDGDDPEDEAFDPKKVRRKGGSSGGQDPNPNPGDDPEKYIDVMSAGSLIFTTIVPLYEQLGSPSTIQSSLTGKYEVVGLVFDNEKYYYKLYDSSLKKYYYAEVTNAANFTTPYTEVLASKEGEETMMLSSPETDKLNFAKLTDSKTAYFIKDTVGEDNKFAVVLDGSDGNTYYVPVDDAVQLVELNTIIPEGSLMAATANSAA